MRRKKADTTTPTRQSVALCLGGGGARGFAHIGALRAFAEAELSFDCVVGTSVGALVGALYAFGITPETMMREAEKVERKDIHRGILKLSEDPMKIGKLVTDIIGGVDVRDAKIKFAAVAVDLVTGKQVVLDTGNVGAVVAASCAVPVLYRPLTYGSMHLVDGGLRNNIPADVCRMFGADHVVTVDVHSARGGGTTGTGMIDVLRATLQMMASNSAKEGLRLSDVVVSPETGEFSSRRKEGWQDMIELGYAAAVEALPRIRELYTSPQPTDEPTDKKRERRKRKCAQ